MPPAPEPSSSGPRYSPLRVVTIAALVTLASLLLGVVLPLGVNYVCGTLYSEQVKAHLKPTPLAQLQRSEASYSQRHRALDALQERLLGAAATPSHEPLADLLQLKADLLKEDKKPRPIIVNGYYLDDSMPLWPLFYAGLGWLAALVAPGSVGRPRWPTREVLIQALTLLPFIFVFYRWPTWFRNTPLGQVGRKVYAYSNIDISHLSFFTQEAMGLLLSALLAIVWAQWLHFFDQRTRELEEQASAETDAIVVDPRRIARLQDTFLHWQLSSVLLGVAFLYSTFFFWARVADDWDPRYIANAVCTHLLWITTWLVMSAPLFITWRDWARYRFQLMTAIASSRKPERADAVMEVLEKANSLSFWNLTGSTVVGLVSLILPIAHALR